MFSQDGNAGLVKQALSRAPRWAIKKLTETYLTLGLREIGAAVGVGVPPSTTSGAGGNAGGEGEGSGASKEVKWKAEDVDVEVVRGIVLDMVRQIPFPFVDPFDVPVLSCSPCLLTLFKHRSNTRK